MKRIADAFENAKSQGRGAFVAYLTIGYPSLAKCEAAIDTLVSEGADIIELGVPFSDPFADGAVIRSAAYEALKQGVTLADVLALAKRVRARHPKSGLVLFSYYNLLFANGLDRFADAAADAGIDAVLAVNIDIAVTHTAALPVAVRRLPVWWRRQSWGRARDLSGCCPMTPVANSCWRISLAMG